MEQKKHYPSLEDSLSQNNKNFTDSKMMLAIISESETWLRLDWVNKKLTHRWSNLQTINFETFNLY